MKRVPWPPCAPKMNPALTTSGKTRTATALDLHLAAAGFCATSCCRARRDWLIKSSADAVPVLSKATVASKSPAAYFHFDVIFIYVFISLGYLTTGRSFRPAFRSGRGHRHRASAVPGRDPREYRVGCSYSLDSGIR